MKKLTIALAIAGAFAATGASAMNLGQYDQGCLVPSAYYDAGSNTVVGLTSKAATTVYWTFFDVNSKHITDGQFAMTANDEASFSWAASGGAGTSGMHGYLVFTSGTAAAATTGTSDIACNAFQVTANDAAFIPVPNLATADYAGGTNLTTMTPTSILTLAGGVPAASTGSHLRYWIDGAAGGRDTAIAVWTANPAKGTYTVNIYDDAQNRKSVNFVLPNDELNLIDPETIVGRPATYLDGFIDWSGAGYAGLVGGLLTYSVVADPAFGATQTLTNPWY